MTTVEQVPAARGRPFAKGNGGRKPGSRNKATQIAAALLVGEAKVLVRKAKELALAGDVTMLKFLLGRILPGQLETASLQPGSTTHSLTLWINARARNVEEEHLYSFHWSRRLAAMSPDRKKHFEARRTA